LERLRLTPLVVTIGATDPWNAAGVGLDVRALAACGARALTVVAGVTAQDRSGVHAAVPIEATMIVAQFAALASAEIAAVRIGALLSPASVHAVVDWLRARREAGVALPVVCDPVFAPSGGGEFASESTIEAIAVHLLPYVSLVTPNLDEVARLTHAPVPATSAAMAAAGRTLQASGVEAVLVTGGHLAGEPLDVLVTDQDVRSFSAPRLPGSLRGTGCLLACGIAAALARGEGLVAAIESGRAFVRDRFAHAQTLASMRVAY